ncbi:hypothetical protein GCM10007385_11650 [Tateyamaria omphalii]|uniref:DUF4169 family protein n=1 Tax=Tateyamaria omphalii TaxID=299262 RepID=UPI0016766634|nr:DUF4169 family protein [Tateyamaria omphalii]GGX45828.1 hypothetical protein GCM10007385_11650 [Tateyamaria omphalii]
MTTPINLNKVRKARARADKKARADANAITFGLTKAEKDHAKRENSRSARDLDGKAAETSPYGANGGDKKP